MKAETGMRVNGSFEDADLFGEYLAGLRRRPKRLSSKFFYDDFGSRLFEEICLLEEYYPTRAELEILDEQAGAISEAVGGRVALVELGSGSGEKGRLLLRVLREPAVYVPVEISREQLLRSVKEVRRRMPRLLVDPLPADYTQDLVLPPGRGLAEKVLFFFPGSTIGNFDPAEAIRFLRKLAVVGGDGAGLLVGVDLKKEKKILDAAYNDAAGVTAAFNLNILARANREWGADFDPRRFRHCAFYEEAMGRVVMQLESLADQEVRMGGRRVSFRAAERVTTEYSYKYGIAEFQAIARRGGFVPRAVWTDSASLFSLHYLTAA